MFKIGNIEIKNNIVLAPMAGVCNSAFRKIIKEMGCGLIYAEMVSDKALVYNSKKISSAIKKKRNFINSHPIHYFILVSNSNFSFTVL